MNELKRVLLAEDSAKDVELTLEALEEHRLANEVVVARDGAEAWDYLRCRGKFAARPPGNPAVVLSGHPRFDAHAGDRIDITDSEQCCLNAAADQVVACTQAAGENVVKEITGPLS